MKKTGKLTVCRPTLIGSIDDQSRYSFDQREHVKFVELGSVYLEDVVTFDAQTLPRTDDANQGTRHPRKRIEQANACVGADQRETREHLVRPPTVSVARQPSGARLLSPWERPPRFVPKWSLVLSPTQGS